MFTLCSQHTKPVLNFLYIKEGRKGTTIHTTCVHSCEGDLYTMLNTTMQVIAKSVGVYSSHKYIYHEIHAYGGVLNFYAQFFILKSTSKRKRKREKYNENILTLINRGQLILQIYWTFGLQNKHDLNIKKRDKVVGFKYSIYITTHTQ